MWANILRARPGTSSTEVPAPVWLDLLGLVSGEQPAAFLFSQMVNRTAHLEHPQQRWEAVHDYFQDAPRAEGAALGVYLDPTRGVPVFEYELFDREFRRFRWKDPSFAVACDGSALETINIGVTLYQRARFGRAVACWERSIATLPPGSE